MTYAVHNLHTAPVEVIENGASRFYRVSSTGAELPLQFASVPGKQEGNRKARLAKAARHD